jgi:CheY-like chemotaxis protein
MGTDNQIITPDRAATTERSCFLCVLVVDDDETHRHLMEMVAEHLQIIVHAVATAEEGLDLLPLKAFDIVLLDLRMPTVDGFDFAQRWRKTEQATSRPRMPILAVTASAFPDTRGRCLAAGMDDYLSKPFELDQLKEKINALTASVSAAEL